MLLRDTTRLWCVVAGTVSLCGAAPASAWAQAASGAAGGAGGAFPARLSASLDVGVARVDYDEFLPSGLVSMTALLRADMPRGVLGLRGSVARYDETGNLNVQGGVVGSAFGGPWRGLRGEIGGALVTGHHQTVGGSGGGQVQARLHAARANHGVWVGGGLGWSSFDGGFGAAVRYAEVAGWFRDEPWRARLSFQPAFVGALRYGDAVGALRYSGRRVELGLEAGLRTGDSLPTTSGVRTNQWVSVDGVYWLNQRLGLVAAIGRAPADPVVAAGGGRYASLALRVVTRPTRSEEPARVLLPRPTRTQPVLPGAVAPGTSGPDAPAGAEEAEALEVVELGSGQVLLRMALPGARTAELMGDATGWEPVPLRRAGDGRWEITLSLDPGVHRVNLRVDGGDWRVPPRLTAVDDGFGGRVGLLVVRR